MKKFRFRGLKNDGEIIETDDINDFRVQDFYWIEENVTMTKDQMESYVKKLRKSHEQRTGNN